MGEDCIPMSTVLGRKAVSIKEMSLVVLPSSIKYILGSGVLVTIHQFPPRLLTN